MNCFAKLSRFWNELHHRAFLSAIEMERFTLLTVGKKTHRTQNGLGNASDFFKRDCLGHHPAGASKPRKSPVIWSLEAAARVLRLRLILRVLARYIALAMRQNKT